jgi:hypothetical protein
MGCVFYKSGIDKLKTDIIPKDLWSIEVTDIDGKTKTMNDYKGTNKAFLFVNVACR